MKVLELKGLKSLRAMNVFHTLMLGLKMLPAYAGESYEEFFDRVSQMAEADQEKLIREAVLFVELEQAEVEAVLCFCTDPNGVPFGKENVKNLGPDQIMEAIVAVSMQIAKIKVDLVSPGEKKKSLSSP